jgi:signal peptidase I
MHSKVRTDSAAASGRVKLELFEAGVSHRVEFDLAKGTVQFFRGERPLAEPVEARIGDGKPHVLAFANVDDRLTLWIDGRTPFGTGAGVTFDRDPIESRAPTAEDLSPARVGVSGDASVVVSDLVLQRDIYYSLDPRESSRGDYARLGIDPSLESMSDVSMFPLIDHLQPRDFTVRPKHYFMLGDNSPRSADSRGWRDADQMLRDPNSGEVIAGWDPNVREPWELPESLILGKAFYIYWPHGVPVWPNIPLTRDLRVPFRPNVERMRFIR